MRVHHLVKVHFDRRTSAITQEWLNERYEFFWNNTFRSLQNQTFKDWMLWLSFGDEGMYGMWEKLKRRLESQDLHTHIDWGCTFNDHKPEPWMYPRKSGTDYVYVTRCDSDDLLAPDTLQIVHDTLPQEMGRVEASMFRRGYLHDIRTGEVGVYKGDSTPFHTLMVPREVFCDPVRYAALDYGDHSLVNSRYPTKVLPDWRFTVLVHGRNFISDMSYGRERIFNVERSWSVERFLKQPVTFDVDDFCDQWNCLRALDRLKDCYPNFKCTLFTIPQRTSLELMARVNNRDWIEMALHGSWHDPNEELKAISASNLKSIYDGFLANNCGYVKGFRPPGWYITAEHIKVLNELGMWVALHKRDERTLGPLCEHGYYVCNDRPNWHGHTHDVCGNGIDECLPELLEKWPRDQAFSFVSESVGVIK